MGNQSKEVFRDTKGTTYPELIGHFFGSFREGKAGKIVLGAWAAGSLVTFILGFWQRKIREAKRRNNSKKTEKTESEPQKSLLQELKLLLPLAFPSPFSRSSIHLLLFTVNLIVRILLTVKIAKMTGRLGKLIGSGQFTKMFRLQAVFALWCFPAAIVNSLLYFFSNELALSMRVNLTKAIHELYFNHLVFYRSVNIGKNKMEDVDHRTTQDLKKLTTTLSEMYGNLLKPILEVVILSHSLSQLMGFRNLLGFFAFFGVSAQWLRFVMPPFAELTAEGQKLEGEFRSHHSRLISHSEEIAFYGGAQREKEITDSSFRSLVKLSSFHHLLQMATSIFDSYLVKYGASMVAYSMLIPAVYLGFPGIDKKSPAGVMEYYLTSTQVLLVCFLHYLLPSSSS